MTNALLVSSPYKLVPPPRESDWNPWRMDSQKTQLNQALLQALQDSDLHDVFLVAKDGDQIPASRFVLASRSPVLKRMLYGSFREAKSSTICMMGYESAILRGVVHYCQTSQMPVLEGPEEQGGVKNTQATGDLESLVRQQVRLYQAADFLELDELGNLVHFEIRRLTGLYPGLACVVFDEVEDVGSRIGEYARLMMEVRPYVSLGAGTRLIANPVTTSSDAATGASPKKIDSDDDSNESMGGVECMRAERLQILLQSENLMCGELFLFQMLRQWYDHKITYLGNNVNESTEYEKEASSLLEATQNCAKCLNMENIEPSALLQIVQPCPFIHPTFMYEAFAKQALRASQQRVWSLHSRPAKYQTVERVLVEDCGSRQVRGMYVRMVSGLKKTHGALYTKREIVAGQPMVYTLSCSLVHQPAAQSKYSQNQDGSGAEDVPPGQEVVECRIFCSPLLTPHAIPTLFQYYSNSAYVDPLFQPILQIVAVKHSSSNKRTRTVVVSDGHYCMQASLANNLAIHNSKDIQIYGVVQVLAFRLNQSSGSSNSSTSSNIPSRSSSSPKLHIQRVSIVNSNAGQVFGRPTFFRGPPKQELSPQKDIHSIAEETDDGDSHHPLDTDDVDDHPPPHHHYHHDGDDASTTYAGHHHAVVKDLKHITIVYSCSYPLKKQNPNGSPEMRIPRLGWQVEEAGQHPPPTCTWFPAMPASASSSPAVGAMRGLAISLKAFAASNPHAGTGGGEAQSTSSTPSRSVVSRSNSSTTTGHSLLSLSTTTTVPKNLGSILKYEDDEDHEFLPHDDDVLDDVERRKLPHPVVSNNNDDDSDEELSSTLQNLRLPQQQAREDE